MPPRAPLNDRFRSYERRARIVRALGRGMAAVCLIVTAGYALEMNGLSAHALARDALARVGSAFASARGQLAAVSLFRLPANTPQRTAPPRKVYAVATTTPSIESPPRTSNDVAQARPTRQTVITNPVIERIVERALPTYTIAQGGITEAILNDRLNQLDNKLSSEIFSLSASLISVPNSLPASGGVTNNIALSQKIDQLPSTVTVGGAPVVTSNTLSNTVSNYLPLSGGTVTGDLTVNGSFSGGSISLSIASTTDLIATNSTTTNATSTNLFSTVARATTGIFDSLLTAAAATITNLTATDLVATNATTTNATTTNFAALRTITAPYYTATSTTATSTFAGGLTVGSNAFTVLQNGNVGIGNTNPATKLEVSGTASSSALVVSSLSGLLKGNGASAVTAAAAGVDYVSPANLAAAFPFTPQAWGNSTSTTIGFGNGIVSNASSTFASSLYLTSLTSGGLGIDANGRVYAAATSTLTTISGTLALAQLATQAGNTVLVNNTALAAAPIALSTSTFASTLYSGSAGQTLAFLNGAWVEAATTTNTCNTGVSCTYGSGTWTFTNTYGYPFTTSSYNGQPTAATSSALWLTNTTLSLAASSTFASFASSTNASTTQITATTQWFTGLTNSGLGVDVNGRVYAAATTTLTNGAGITTTYSAANNQWTITDTNGYPFTTSTTSATTTSATTTSIWTQGVFFASSTAAASVFPFASSTAFTVSGMSYLQGGFLSLASSTIGNGTQAGGLTINGGATTTGNVYFAGNVGIGTTSPATTLSVAGSGYFTTGLGVGAVNTTAGTILAQKAGTASLILQDTTGAGSRGGFIGGSWGSNGLFLDSLESSGWIYIGTAGAGGGAAGQIRVQTNSADRLFIDSTGNTGIGAVTVSGASFTAANMTVLNSGNVGIASTTPWRTLSVAGTVGFDGLTAGAGAGALCLSANKEVTYSAGAGCTGSSQRFKHDIAPLDSSSSLDTVLKLNPVSFVYNDDIGVKGPQVGLIAEQVRQVEPRLVATDASGTPFTVKYENFTAILAGAIQEVASISGSFKDALIAWFADAANGITYFFAAHIRAHDIHADQLCAGNTCVNEQQLAALLASAGQSLTPAPSPSASSSSPTAAAASSTAPAASSTPPVLSIAGENPAHIHVGDTYADLGATITAPEQDKNLGIHTFLNGTLVSDIVLDTSTTTTDTIDYVATDTNGLTSTSTRTVIIEAIPAETATSAPQ